LEQAEVPDRSRSIGLKRVPDHLVERLVQLCFEGIHRVQCVRIGLVPCPQFREQRARPFVAEGHHQQDVAEDVVDIVLI
jgi:hypothetical protein